MKIVEKISMKTWVLVVMFLSSCMGQDRSEKHREVIREAKTLAGFPKDLVKKHECYGQIMRFWKPSKISEFHIKFLLYGKYHCVVTYPIKYSEKKSQITDFGDPTILYIRKIESIVDEDGQISISYDTTEERKIDGVNLEKIIAGGWDLPFLQKNGGVENSAILKKLFEERGLKLSE